MPEDKNKEYHFKLSAQDKLSVDSLYKWSKFVSICTIVLGSITSLSIFFLARELVMEEGQRSRLTLGRPWVMAFVFGLLHGLGFAGALADIGLPKDDLWLSLLLFNVGIEVGQAAVIIALAGIAWILTKIGWRNRFYTVAAWSMGSLATFWTLDRTALLVGL